MLKTLSKRQVHWIGIKKDVQNVLNNCLICCNSLAKVNKLRHVPEKVIVAEDCNDLFELDIAFFPPCGKTKHDLLLNGVNHFTKMCYSISGTRKNSKFVEKTLDGWYKQHSFKRLYCDKGKEFDNNVIKSWCAKNQVKFVDTLPYTPWSKGCIEIRNKNIKEALTCKMKIHQNSYWTDYLKEVVDSFNQRVHTTTKHIPAEVTKVLEEEIDVEDFSDQSEYYKKVALQWKLTSEIYENTLKAGNQKQISKAKGKKIIQFNVGDKVFIAPPPKYRRRKQFPFTKIGILKEKKR